MECRPSVNISTSTPRSRNLQDTKKEGLPRPSRVRRIPSPGKVNWYVSLGTFFVGTGAKPLARSETKKNPAVLTPQGAFPSAHDWLTLLLTPGYRYQENRLP